MGLIYCLTSPSGKKYVGKTIRTLAQRLKEHSRDFYAQRPFSCAVRKYGIDAFKAEILVDDVEDHDLLLILESEWIAKLKQDGEVLYNATEGGEGTPGAIKPEHVKKFASEFHTELWKNEEYQEKMSKANLKAWESDERRAKASETHKALWADPERKKFRSAKIKASMQSDEYRQKASARSLGSKNPAAKITEEDVTVILQRIKTEKYKDVAKDYGIHPGSISMILSGQTWSKFTGIKKRGKSSDKSVQPDPKS